jgi:hypothetical protein
MGCRSTTVSAQPAEPNALRGGRSSLTDRAANHAFRLDLKVIKQWVCQRIRWASINPVVVRLTGGGVPEIASVGKPDGYKNQRWPLLFGTKTVRFCVARPNL